MSKQTLKIGILVDSTTCAIWVRHVLEKIIDSNHSSLELIIHNTPMEPSTKPKKSNPIKNFSHRAFKKILNKSYSLIVERKLRVKNAHIPTNIEDLIENVPIITVNPTRKKFSDYINEEDIKKIRGYNLDVLLRFGFRILRGDILNCASQGIWSYHHGDNRINRGGPPGYWESMQNWSSTGSVLQRLSEELDGGKILYRSESRTDFMSIQDNKSNFYWKSSQFIIRVLEKLYNLGADDFELYVETLNRDPDIYSERLYKAPNNTELFQLVSRKIFSKIATVIKGLLYIEQWILLYEFKANGFGSVFRYNELVPPKDRFWADPWVIYKDNRHYVFFEEFMYSTKKGHISVLSIDSENNVSEPKIVLDKPYHLSYPHVFEWKGEIFMVPETSRDKNIQLLKARNFPHEWEHVRNIMEDIRAVDSTLLHFDDRWWLFVNIAEVPGASTEDELFIFHADHFDTDQWTPHAMNPVVSSCQFSRPAGKIFDHNGCLYRPSQDCRKRYGYQTNLMKITCLNPQEYAETPAAIIRPNWKPNVLGTHTFINSDGIHVIDAQVKRPRYW